MERVTSPTSVTPSEAGLDGKTTGPIGPHEIPPPLRAYFDRFARAFKPHRDTQASRALFLQAWPHVKQLRELLPIQTRARDIDAAIAMIGVPPSRLAAAIRWAYMKTYCRDSRLAGDVTRDRIGLRRTVPQTATPGTPGYFGTDYFRSQWEQRVAKVLTALGIRWTYEPDYFVWEDRRGRGHRYTPDFRLDDLSNVYVEVKGPAGAASDAAWKMERVLARYPNLTLLLWDAGTVEYIEDLTDPRDVLGLLNTTRLAA